MTKEAGDSANYEEDEFGSELWKEHSEEELLVGVTRVCDSDGFMGTVMYVGPVASAKKEDEIYAGIVWDDDTRGKHDGSVICRRTNQLIRHFSCPSPSGGSFLRYHKLNRGCWLDEELMKKRYVEPDADLVAPDNLLPHVALTSSGRSKAIELLGELKIRSKQQLTDLRDISLRGLSIRGIQIREDFDEYRRMKESYRHVEEIDLAGNLLCDWESIWRIFTIFPGLTWASFAANRIRDLNIHQIQNCPNLEKMRVLNLNGCSIQSYSTIQLVGKIMPNLEELCVAHSCLSDMCSDTETNAIREHDSNLFQKLKLLDCTNCQLTSWSNQIIPHLSQLPMLETLILDDNLLSSFSIPLNNDDHDKNCFPSLLHLQITGTNTSSFSDINDLAHLQKLESLRFRSNPITNKMGAGEARALVIARLPSINHLNGSTISEKERLEAERRYVSIIARELLVSQKQQSNEEEAAIIKQNILKNHPQFERLIIDHKQAMMSATASASMSSHHGNIAHSIINITISSMAAESCTVAPMQKRVPCNLKVGRLKIMCSKAFQVDVELQLLHFKSNPSDPFPTELDDDGNTLAYYGVSDGAEVYMNEVDVKAQQRQAQLEAEDLNRRLREQEQATNQLQSAKSNDVRAYNRATQNAALGV